MGKHRVCWYAISLCSAMWMEYAFNDEQHTCTFKDKPKAFFLNLNNFEFFSIDKV